MISVRPFGRHYAVYEDEALLAVCVYRRGAEAVRDRVEGLLGRNGQGSASDAPIGVAAEVRSSTHCGCLIAEEYLAHLGRPCPHVVCDESPESDEGRALAPGESVMTGAPRRPLRVAGSYPGKEVNR